MKQFLRSLSALIVLVLFSIGAQAQISNYSFSESTGNTFSSISSTGTSVTLGDDDDVQVNIGFTFTYNSTGYTQLNIGSNGYIAFGSNGATSYSNDIGSTSSGKMEVVAPLWDDMNPGAGGNIYYETQGSSPNRTFIVEYNALAKYGGGATFTAQVVLYESSSNIEIKYGAQSGSFSSASIGINESPGGSSHFISVTPATPSTSSTSTADNSITAPPADGTNYLFTYTAPSCPTPGSLTESSITSSSVSLGWTENGSATTWDIEYGPTGFTQGSGTTISGTTSNPYSLTGLSSKTTYDWYVRADCGGGSTSSWAGPSTFTTPGSCGTYKIDLIDSYGDGWNGGYIDIYVNGTAYASSVTLSSGSGPESHYVPMDIGDILSIDYTAGSYSDENEYKVYDENGNLVQDEGSGSNTPGDVGDYTVPTGLTSCPACPDPTAQTESSITSSSVSLGWTENGSATTWDIEYGPTGFTQGTGTTVSVTTKPYSLTGLSAATTYDWYVRADCGGGSTSSWVGPSTFTTACTTKSTPWSDDVEAHSATTNSSIANCWSSSPSGTSSSFRWDIDASGSTPSSSTGPSGAHSGSKYFYTEASYGSTGDIAELYSPNIDLTGLSAPMLEFYYHMYGADMGNLHVDVYDGTWHNDVMTAISGQQQTADTDPWIKQTVDLSSYSGTIQIRFRGEKGGSYRGDMSLDDIAVKETPTCPDPTAQTESSITLNSADLGWTENGSATTWDIEYGPTGFTQGAGTTISGTTTNPYSLSGLTANTSYDWYVRADCGGGSTSNWTGPHTFTTNDGKATNPTPADAATGVLVSATTLDWDDVPGASGYHISIGTTSGGTDIVNNASASSSQYTYGSNWSYSTQYYWTVTTDYSGGTVTGTEWSFTSECGTFSSFPYTQDFSSWAPLCWDVDHTSTGSNYDWDQYNSANARANFWNQSGGNTDIMVSPTFDVSGLTTPSLDFDWSHKYDSGYPDDSLSVEISDDGGSTWHQIWTKGGANLESNDGAGNTAPGSFVNTGDIDLSSYGNTISIRFYATSGYGPDLFIDNVRIREKPACPDPSAQTESSITTSGADLGWTENGTATNWDIEYGPTGFTQGTGTTVAVTANPYSLSGLSSNTTYDWYVRADCGSGSTSSWVGPHSFTTSALAPNCATSPSPADAATGVTSGSVSLSWTAPADDATHDPATSYDVYFGTTSGSLSLQGNTSSTSYTVNANEDLKTYYWQVIPKNSGGSATGCSEWSFTTAVTQSATTQTAPWSDDFSTHSGGTGTTTNGWVTNPTSGFAWTISTGGTTPSSSTGPSADNTGDSHFIFTEASSGSQGSVAYLYSPKLDLSALTTPELTFYYHMYGATMGDLHIDVYNGSSYTNDVSTALSGQQQSAQGDAWLKYTVNLSSYSGTIHIRFRGVRGSNYTGDMSIDDFDIHEAPSCPDPTAQTESNISETAADLGWTENGTATTWNIEWGPTGFSQGSGTMVTGTTTNPYSLSGLSAATTYDWYVQSDCGGGSTSNWTGPHSFTTTAYSVTTNGQTTICSPLYARSGSTKQYFYDKYSFSVPTAGNYDIIANWDQGSGSTYDGYLYLYENSFDPDNPATNQLASDDDNDNGNGSTHGSKIENQSLSTGTTYIVVGTSYGANKTIGSMEFIVEGPGSATAPASTDYNGTPGGYTHNPPSTDGTSRTASYECDDRNGITHYYYNSGSSTTYSDDVLLLSIDKNGNNIGSVGDGTFSLTLAGAAGASHITNPPASYVSAANGWWVFNRYWKVTPTSQPSSSVYVTYYYETADYTALQNAINDEGSTPPTSHTDMACYKINNVSNTYDPDPANGHSGVPLAASNGADGCWIYTNGGSVSQSNWKYTNLGGDLHSMETAVTHFSGGGGGSGDNSDGDGSPLPVELLSLNGNAYPAFNLIRWTTASENNTKEFIVERSPNAKDEIVRVGKTRAAGNSKSLLSYDLKDQEPLTTAYYRLVSIDYDGVREVSKWILIRRKAQSLSIVSIYPNPATQKAFVEILSPERTKAVLEVRDVTGRVLLSEGLSLEAGTQTRQIDFSTLDAGSYQVSLNINGVRLTKTVIKQ